LKRKKEYDGFKKLYDATLNRAQLLDNSYKTMQKKMLILKEIPCGTQFPNCRFIQDAHTASVEIPGIEKEVLIQVGKAKEYKSKVVTVNSKELSDLITKYNNIVNEKNSFEINRKDNEIKIEKLRAFLKNLNLKLAEVNDKISLYKDKEELIHNIEILLAKKNIIEEEISNLGVQVNKIEIEISQAHRVIGSLEQKVIDLNEKKKELQDIREEFTSYDLFMRCVHSNGIAYDIIKKRLPIINSEISKIISNIVDFEVFFEEDGNKLDIFIKHPRHEPRPIEMGSGAEKTIAAMGIRLALLSVSSLPKPSLMILDEPATSLDSENMEGFIRILQLVKSYFKTVLLISHLDSLKDIVDIEIVIDKVDGFAQIKE
jgi:DNA repair exonuclease SbcCD ATPase subunit